MNTYVIEKNQQRERKERKERKETSGVGESLLRRVSVTVALLLSVSVQAQGWVSRDGVTRRYTGGSELGFCSGKLLGSQLLDPGGGGSESSTIAAKDSEERRLFQLCAVVKFPGCRGVLGFLEESPSGTVEALRCKEDSDCEAFSGVVLEFRFGPGICVSDLRFGNGESCGDATSSRHVSLVVEDGNTCPSSFNEEMCETASAFAGVS
ncbi:hypothetical protein YC2023_046260 [Brassica napus]